jgi:hypothetical protein
LRTVFRGFAGLFIVVVPLLLLINPRAAFYNGTDWDYHLWLIGYFGEYFRHQFIMPAELNATVAVGMALPLFYGYLLYPLLGFFSAGLGAAGALRLGCLLVVAVQFYALFAAGRRVLRHRGLAYATAVVIVWSTYSLTNLYNRSALPEYFATGCLMASIGFLVAAAGGYRDGRARFHFWLAGVSGILAVGVHPPTAVVSGVFLIAVAVILAGAWAAGPRHLARMDVIAGGAIVAAGALIVSPWLYVTLRLGPKLAIWADPYQMILYPDRFDSWVARLSPVPYDPLSARQGIVDVSTPFLEAPIALGLVVLFGWLFFICLRSPRRSAAANNVWTAAAPVIAGLALGWFGILLALSLSATLNVHFLFLGPYLQYAYRLVSHANAALLIAVFAGGALAHRCGAFTGRRSQADIVAAICIVMAAISVGIKLGHGQAVAQDEGASEYALGGERARLIGNPSPYAVATYTTPGEVSELSADELRGATTAMFVVGREGREFGQVAPVRVWRDRPGWVVTNALVFAWNRIAVQGVRVGGGDLRRSGSFLAVRLPVGETELTWEWHPDPVWSALHCAGGIAFAGVLLITAVWASARAAGFLRARFS